MSKIEAREYFIKGLQGILYDAIKDEKDKLKY